VVGTLLAVLGISDNLIGFLSWLGILIPPVGGVIIGDWWARWRREMPAPSEIALPAVRWENLGAYVLAAAVAWASEQWAWGIAPINGIVVAVLAALVVSRFRRMSPVPVD